MLSIKVLVPPRKSLWLGGGTNFKRISRLGGKEPPLKWSPPSGGDKPFCEVFVFRLEAC